MNEETLTENFKNLEVEILSDEVEFISEHTFSHKILFSTKKEINILFEDAQISIHTAASSDYKKCLCIFDS